MNLLARVYTALLHLYPREFREKFGDEMRITYADSITEVSLYGFRTLLRVNLREILGLIPAIVQEHLQRKDKSQELVRMLTQSAPLVKMLVPLLLVVLGLGVLGWQLQHIDDGLNIFRATTSLADIDKDGDLDVIVGRTRWETLSTSWAGVKLWLNQGSGKFIRSDQELPGFAAGAGDVDGDGDNDLMGLSGYDLTLALNQGGQPPTFKTNNPTFPPKKWNGYMDMGGSVILADLNSDGKVDGFVAGCCYGSTQSSNDLSYLIPSSSWVWINKWGPDGWLVRDTQSIDELEGLPIRGLALGDLDGDGDLDAFAAIGKPTLGEGIGLVDRVMLNNGSGNFTDSGQRLGETDSTSVALGDVDGDGDLDALVGTRNGSVVWINQGGMQEGQAGVFAISQQVIASGETTAVFLADLDRDGTLDALIAGQEQADIWWNYGRGILQQSNQRFRYTPRHGLAVADFNGDGYADIFAGTHEQDYTVWLNQRNGTFQAINR